VRKLGREELLLYLIATAALAEHPKLIPQAIEEILRWEPPALQIARYV
jgi:cytochrome P450